MITFQVVLERRIFSEAIIGCSWRGHERRRRRREVDAIAGMITDWKSERREGEYDDSVDVSSAHGTASRRGVRARQHEPNVFKMLPTVNWQSYGSPLE